MNIETYKNGILIESQSTESHSIPDISLFISLMFNNGDYQILSRNSNNQFARSRLELGIVRIENKPISDNTDWQFIIDNWNNLIDDCEKTIFSDSVAVDWQNIVQSCGLPIIFDENLRMGWKET